MNNLDKVKLIKKTCADNNITAYEVGKGTGLSVYAVQKLLSGETKKPNNKTVDSILEFLESAIVGTNIKKVKEPQAGYKDDKSLEERIADVVVGKLKPYFKNLENALAENVLDMDDLLDKLEDLQKSKAKES